MSPLFADGNYFTTWAGDQRARDWKKDERFKALFPGLRRTGGGNGTAFGMASDTGDEGHCGLSSNDSSSSSNSLGLNNPYGGIPQNLIFNTVLLALLLIVSQCGHLPQRQLTISLPWRVLFLGFPGGPQVRLQGGQQAGQEG